VTPAADYFDPKKLCDASSRLLDIFPDLMAVRFIRFERTSANRACGFAGLQNLAAKFSPTVLAEAVFGTQILPPKRLRHQLDTELCDTGHVPLSPALRLRDFP
jgi:hypothetical protein